MPTGGHAQSAVRIRRSEVPIEVPSGSWALMDQVDLEEEFFRRTPMLKHSISITLQERCRAKLVGEERAWKASGFVPGNVGKLICQKGLARAHTGPPDTKPVLCQRTQSRKGTEKARSSSVQPGEARTGVSRAQGDIPKNGSARSHLRCCHPRPLDLDSFLFAKCLASAPSGSAPVRGGCTYEMLKVCLEDAETLHLLFRVAEDLARAEAPEPITRAFMTATMTALLKHDGGVRGSRLGRGKDTLARQFGKAVEAVCAPFQFALSTRVGTDCMGHAIRPMTDADPECTVLSIDGVGAYDHVLRSRFPSNLHSVPRTVALCEVHLPQTTTYVWEDGAGVRHRNQQAEGGEQETHSCHCCSVWGSTTLCAKFATG